MINITKLSAAIGIYRTAITSRLDRLNIIHLGRDLDDRDLERYFKAEKSFRSKKIKRLQNEADELNRRIEKEKSVIDSINNY